MRLANLGGRLVLVDGWRALDVATASEGRFGPHPLDAYRDWDAFVEWASAADVSSGNPYGSNDLGCPVPDPSQVFGIGLNYADHAAEAGMPLPDSPMVFTKFASCLTGPTGEIPLVPGKVDWEAELVVVIGRGGRGISVEDALDHVAGLTVGQDVSERALQTAGANAQFNLGKSHDRFGPIGPVVVTLDELADPHDLAIGCSLDDQTVQDSRTSQMVFGIAELVSYLSRVVELRGGDVIFTGTPPGVGVGRSPQRFVVDGEVLTTWIEGIGEMRHRFVAPAR